MLCQQLFGKAVQRRVRRRHLHKDVHAVGILFQHAADAAHLPLDAVQAVDEGFHFLRRSLFMLMAGFTLMIAAIHGLIPPVIRYPHGVC